MNSPLDWMFFDCFNTLLAEPGGGERFPYLTPLADLPVQYGLYDSSIEFLTDYTKWYESRWPGADTTPASDRGWGRGSTGHPTDGAVSGAAATHEP